MLKWSKNRIQEVLKERGYNYISPSDELLLKLGVSKSRFQNILHNRTRISILEVKSFAAWLNVPTDKLINNNDLHKKPEKKRVIQANPVSTM